MANRKSSKDLDRELDTPIPWVSALVIAAMALLMFAGVAFGADDVDVSAERARLELGRQYIIAELADKAAKGEATDELAAQAAAQIVRIDFAIIASYLPAAKTE